MNRFKRLLFARNPRRLPPVRNTQDAAIWNDNGVWMQDVGDGPEPLLGARTIQTVSFTLHDHDEDITNNLYRYLLIAREATTVIGVRARVGYVPATPPGSGSSSSGGGGVAGTVEVEFYRSTAANSGQNPPVLDSLNTLSMDGGGPSDSINNEEWTLAADDALVIRQVSAGGALPKGLVVTVFFREDT